MHKLLVILAVIDLAGAVGASASGRFDIAAALLGFGCFNMLVLIASEISRDPKS